MEHLSDSNNPSVFPDKVPLFCTLPLEEYKENRTLQEFWILPESLGWSIGEDGDLQPKDSRYTLNEVTQRWLYFEVLAQMFGDLHRFRWTDFLKTDDDGHDYVNTSKLPEYLEDWLDREKSEPGNKRTLRLTRIQQVLVRAKYFVSRYCSVKVHDDSPTWELNRLLPLSFMVLGETLMYAQTKVLKAIDSRIVGWFGHDSRNHGWGYSQYVLEMLRNDGWCAKAICMLQALLRGNVIGLLHLYTIRDASAAKGIEHGLCTSSECLTKTVKPQAFHYCTHARRPVCEGYKTIKGSDVAQIIRNGNIPLAQWHPREQSLKLIEMKASFDKRYAIFSHVWADGFGSCDKKNRLNVCVLNMFTNLFKQINRDGITDARSAKPELFWIDTLSIPVEDEYISERIQAIRQMHNIYTHAQYTIVLDKSLMRIEKGSGYSGPAMKIAMSRWMTRMWTLQEAVLSRQIYFAFSNQVYSVDQLENLYTREAAALHTCVPSLAQIYYHGILGEKRDRVHNKMLSNERWKPKALFIATVWKAAQWRSTEHPHHETLSLATLLNVDTTPFAKPSAFKEGTAEYLNDCDRRMHQFLFLLSDIVPCPIPPGMIFLPGPRLAAKGYGWAPKTWLSSREIDPPDPLAFKNGASKSNENTTFDTREGLEVEFPGFFLHHLTGSRDTLRQRKYFAFATESSLMDWYSVEIADANDHFPDESILKERDLAILASRIPSLEPKEIALLVAINRIRSARYYVEIINRVWLTREEGQGKLTDWSRMFRQGSFESICIAERLSVTQRWCVDGPNERKHDIPEPARPIPILPPLTDSGGSLFKKVGRAVTWRK